MTYIGASFTLDDVETGGTDLIKSSFSKLVENEGLWEEFLRCGDMSIPVSTIKKIYIDLLKKTFHLRIGVITDRYNEVHTGHYSNASSQTF
jgi:hypothetical protein